MHEKPQDGWKHTTWRIPTQAHQELRILAIKRKMSCQDLIAQILCEYLAQQRTDSATGEAA